MSETENYEYITNHIDIDNFIDYSILEIFVGNHDWPYNNIKIWHQKPSSKWRFLLFDTDFAFGGGVQEAQYKNPHFNSFNYSLHYYNTYLVNEKPIVWREMMKRLLINEKFRKQFLNRFADLMNSNLEPAKIMGTMNQLSQTLEPEINRHIERWEKSTIPWYTLSDWNSAINQMKEYIEGSGESKPRRDYVFEHLTNYFDDIDGTSTITIEPPCGGTVSINTVTPSSPPWSGTYFNNIPITLSATANNGFEFVQWSDGSTEAVYEKTLTNSENMKALFKRKESNRVKNHDASQSLNYWVASSELVKTDDEVGDKMFFLATGTTLAQQIDVTCEQELISKGALMISTHAEAKAASNAMASLTVEFMNQNNETIAITDSSSSPAWEGIQMKKIPVPSATTSIKLILSADVESNRRINGHVLFDNVSLIHYNRFDAIAKNQKDITKPKLYSSNERVREPPHRRIYKS